MWDGRNNCFINQQIIRGVFRWTSCSFNIFSTLILVLFIFRNVCKCVVMLYELSNFVFLAGHWLMKNVLFLTMSMKCICLWQIKILKNFYFKIFVRSYHETQQRLHVLVHNKCQAAFINWWKWLMLHINKFNKYPLSMTFTLLRKSACSVGIKVLKKKKTQT